MNIITEHPGATYMFITLFGLVCNVVIAVALVSIARSLKNKKDK